MHSNRLRPIIYKQNSSLLTNNGNIPQLNLPATGEEILRRITELKKSEKISKDKNYSKNESEVSLVPSSLISPEKKQVA